MPKPTIAEAEWNVDGTNETAPTASHKSDGWGLAGGGRLGSSTIWNYWARRVYQWLLFLDAFFGNNGLIHANEFYGQSPELAGNVVTGVVNGSTDKIGVQVSANPADLSNAIHHLRKGDRITHLGAYVSGTGAAGVIQISLHRYIAATGSFQSVATLTITDAPVADAYYETNGGGVLPLTVPEGDSYILRLENSSAGGVNYSVWSWGVKKDRL